MNLADEFAGWVTAAILAKEAEFKWIVEPRDHIANGKRSGPMTLRFYLPAAFAQWYEHRLRCGLPRMAYKQFLPLWKGQRYVLRAVRRGMPDGSGWSPTPLHDVDLLTAQAAGVEVVL